MEQRGGANDAARAFVLCGAAAGRRDDLGVSQPASEDRRTPVEVLPLRRPDVEGATRLETAGRTGSV
eukprot:2330071-Alexandrium_andersonii.AAC.1